MQHWVNNMGGAMKDLNPTVNESLTAQDHILDATKNVAEKRPQNCGTGYCSCIDCPYKTQQAEREPSDDNARDNMLLRMIKHHFPSLPVSDEYTNWSRWLRFANAVFEAGRKDAGNVEQDPVAWIAVSDSLPIESDGEVLVRMIDGRCEIAWATYWHGASNDFAQWTFRDSDEDETPTHWTRIPK